MTPARRGAAVAALAAVLAAGGCDLDEITVAEPASRVLAEVYVLVRSDGPRARAFLHRTAGTGGSREVPGARVRLVLDDGEAVELDALERPRCVVDGEVSGGVELPEGEGSCYGLDASALDELGPGDDVRVEIELPGGGSLEGRTRIPGEFRLLGTPGEAPRCRIPPATQLPLGWTAAEGAWAYSTETLIRGLDDVLGDLDEERPAEPLFLLGLSVSAADTSIV